MAFLLARVRATYPSLRSSCRRSRLDRHRTERNEGRKRATGEEGGGELKPRENLNFTLPCGERAQHSSQCNTYICRTDGAQQGWTERCCSRAGPTDKK